MLGQWLHQITLHQLYFGRSSGVHKFLRHIFVKFGNIKLLGMWTYLTYTNSFQDICITTINYVLLRY